MKKIVLNRLVVSVLMIAAMVPVAVTADDIQAQSLEPPTMFPMSLQGTVNVNGQPAPTGSVVMAEINAEERGRVTVETPGLYGDKPYNRLLVTGKKGDMVGNNPVKVNLYVKMPNDNNKIFVQTIDFKTIDSKLPSSEAFVVTQSDINAVSSTPTKIVPVNRGGGGGGGGDFRRPAKETPVSTPAVGESEDETGNPSGFNFPSTSPQETKTTIEEKKTTFHTTPPGSIIGDIFGINLMIVLGILGLVSLVVVYVLKMRKNL